MRLPKGVFIFTNMKYLVLTVHPFDGEDGLDWISYILKAFPFLNKLQVDVSINIVYLPFYMQMNFIELH